MTSHEDTIARIQPPDARAMELARERQTKLTKPPGSLARLEDVAVRIAGMRGDPTPALRTPVVIVAAGDHGVVAQGVSAYPQAVTSQMMANFIAGGAAICVLARQAGAKLVLVDAGIACAVPGDGTGYLDRRAGGGTNDMSVVAAMTRVQARTLLEAGIALVAEEVAAGADVILPGDMGIGNTTAASAMTAALLGARPEDVVGPGTGLDAVGRRHKTEIVTRALAVNRPDGVDALDVLTKVGGFEIAFLAGTILGGAAARVPVVLDGFICGAAALSAWRMASGVREFMVAAHRSAEPGHRLQLEAMGLDPLLDLGLRLGEGSGGALALPVIRAALALHAEMATFGEAAVSGPVGEALPKQVER